MTCVKKIYKGNKTASHVSIAGGFTLVELLLSMVLGAILMSTVAFIFANMASSFAEQPSTGQKFSDYGSWSGDAGAMYIPMAPAYSQLPQAFNLQSQIISELQATKTDTDGGGYGAHSVYVLNRAYDSAGSLTDDSTNLPSASYAPTSLDWYDDLSAANVESSAQFATLLVDKGLATDSTSIGYSIFFMSGSNTVDMVVHVRKYTVDTITIYAVNTFVNGAFDVSLSYAYGITTTDENTYSPIKPGASRITLRTSADWLIYDEIGTRLVFPDPTALPYQVKPTDTASVIRTYSRFATLLPVKQ